MPPSNQSYGLDTSVYVRLLTGHPESDFERTVAHLKAISDASPRAAFFVSNQVIGEAYITLQHHYQISKADARYAMLELFRNGVIEPLNGREVLEILESNPGGAGLLHKLIAQNYASHAMLILTNDKAMGKLPFSKLL